MPEHDWWVYSTASNDHVIMVQDRNSNARGYVENPTREEWEDAFYAPSNPCQWPDSSRVIVDSDTAPEFSEETKASALARADRQCSECGSYLP